MVLFTFITICSSVCGRTNFPWRQQCLSVKFPMCHFFIIFSLSLFFPLIFSSVVFVSNVSRHWVYCGFTWTKESLGSCVWYLCLPLLLPHPCGHYQHLLQFDGQAPTQCPHPVRFQGERPQPATYHQDGPRGGGSFCRLLDAHPDNGSGWVSGLQPEQRVHAGADALLHRLGLRQQQPESCSLRVPGWELQALLQGVLPPLAVSSGHAAVRQDEEHCQGGGRGLQLQGWRWCWAWWRDT